MSMHSTEIAELHRLLSIIQHVDVGLMVLDRQYRVQLWNGFMENHSGLGLHQVMDQSLFELFPEIPRAWFKRKIDSVFLLDNSAYSTWQQRPYLLKFSSYRPITGASEWMYQNVTLFPLTSVTGVVEHVCVMIYDVTETALDEQSLQITNRELDRIGRTDGLTGLYNRRAWEEMLVSEYKRFQRSGNPATLVMFDIDHFKVVNDTCGHPAGDAVIRTVAQLATHAKRDTDIAGRYGGEEFAVILVDTDADGALHFAERLRRAVETHVVRHDETDIRFTISLGIAAIPREHGHEHWIAMADEALYASKKGGRNRVTVHGGVAS